jgi:hypothetical protein
MIKVIGAIFGGTMLLITSYLVFVRGQAWSEGEPIDRESHPERFSFIRLRLILFWVMLGFFCLGGLLKAVSAESQSMQGIAAGAGLWALSAIILSILWEGMRKGELYLNGLCEQRGYMGFWMIGAVYVFIALLVAVFGLMLIAGGYHL